jgi:hypothetical protein
MNDGGTAAEFIFPYLKAQAEYSDSDKKELVTFVRRLLQKRPKYANQVRDLFELRVAPRRLTWVPSGEGYTVTDIFLKPKTLLPTN